MDKLAESCMSPKAAAEDISDTFRANLLLLLKERKISAASISRKAGLNTRAVKDIEERRAKSPRIVTAFKLAEALEVPLQELLGLEKYVAADDLSAALRFFLSLSAGQRELFVAAIRQQDDAAQNESAAAAPSLSQSNRI